MKIALDVDGVLADFHGYTCEKVGIDPASLDTWHFEDSVGPHLAKRMYAIMGQASTWLSLPLCDDAAESVQALHDAGVSFEFVSAVPARFEQERLAWLEHRLGADLEHHPLTLVESKYKAEIVSHLGFTHIVDDKPSTVNEAAERGLVAVLVPSPYMHEIPHHPAVRVMALRAFVNEVTR